MKLFPVKKCKHILKDKYNITKGISRHMKQQLNDLVYTCKHNAYLERNNKIYYLTADMVQMFQKMKTLLIL